VLAHYLEIEPAFVELATTPRGKPILAGSASNAGLSWNLAHSEDLAVLAVARGVEIGVDVELVRPLTGIEAVSRLILTPQELGAFLALTPAARSTAFLRCWTWKEALAKAVGDGLSRPLTRFELDIGPSGPARLLLIDGRLPNDWRVLDLTPAPGYVGALAVGPAVEQSRRKRASGQALRSPSSGCARSPRKATHALGGAMW
jgi:4'-phosphopantetheinyl transferase